jgi:hypothetical protein
MVAQQRKTETSLSELFKATIIGGLLFLLPLILVVILQYRLVKSVAEGLAQIENAEDVKPALVSIEEGWQIGYLLNRLRTAGLPCSSRRLRHRCRAT